MKIIPEIDLTQKDHELITELRNNSFPGHQVQRSYYKQLPHYRFLFHKQEDLIGYMGLDYRVMSVGGTGFMVLGIVDFCVSSEHRGNGVGSTMLSYLSDYASGKQVDFIVLISEHGTIYLKNGYHKVSAQNIWLRIHEFKNYGVASENIDEFYIKSVNQSVWPSGEIDWLGYMF